MIPSFSTLFGSRELAYSGTELRPHFLLESFGLKGSAVGAFIGGCDVETQHLVDWEDRLAQDFIRSKKMLHFIGEFFGLTLREGVLLQRLWTARIGDLLGQQLNAEAFQVYVKGDDLFITERNGTPQKLSVSIVTASPVSVLFHLGINIDPEGAPVAAIGLDRMDLSAQELGSRILQMMEQEWAELQWACAKVRPVV